MKNYYFIILSVIIIIYIISSVRKNKLSVNTSFLWIVSSLIMLLLSIFPHSIDWVAKLFGISYAPTLFLTVCIIFLLILNFNNSKKVYTLNEKIIDLAQELSILKGENNEKK